MPETDLITNEVSNQELAIQMFLEGWKFARAYMRLLQKLDIDEQQRFLGQYRYYIKQTCGILEGLGLKAVNLEGHPFDPGFAITVLNLSDYENKAILFIDQMIEPIIMGPKGVIRMGTALVKQGG